MSNHSTKRTTFASVVAEAQKNQRATEESPLMESSSSHSNRLFHRSSSLVESIFHVTETERQEALQHKGVGQAAFLIRDAVIGSSENPSEGAYDPYKNPDRPNMNQISIFCRRVCSLRPYRRFLDTILWILILLTFFEPPNWCRYLIREGETIDEDFVLTVGRCHELMAARGPAAGNSSLVVDYYPNTSTSTLLTARQSHIVESICLVCLWTFVLLRIGRDGFSLRRFLRRGPAQVARYLSFVSLSCLSLGLIYDMCTQMDKKRPLTPYLRMLIFVSSNRDCLREVKTLLYMMPEVTNVLIILFLFIGFYAWIGVVAFYGSEEGTTVFPNIVDGMWSLWIATTTANYPDVMMAAYNTNRLATVYFVVYMSVTFFFLMNVILASVVNAYDNELDRRRVERQEVGAIKLAQAFDVMEKNEKGRLSRETVMALFLVLNDDFPELRTIPKDEAKILFAILDKDGTDTISMNEFLDFGNIMLLEFEKITVRKTVIERCCPRLYNTRGYKAFSSFIMSPKFEFTIDAILVLNAIVVFIQSYPMLVGMSVEVNPSIADGEIDTAWEVIESIFTVIYVMEMMTKITVNGWHEYVSKSRNIFDMVITLLAVFATAYVYYPNQFSDSRLIRFIVLARVLRLSRLLVLLKPFQLIANIAMDVFARARVILLLLFCVCYVFAALGVQIFGGMISRDPSDPRSMLLLDSDFAANDYWANNFNDMLGAMNVLFNLLVVNNWTECQDGFEAVTQQRWNRFYFLAFHIAGVVLVNNLVVAFIINAFIKQWDYRQEKLKTHVIKGEAVIMGRRALFDATKVTGTSTDLSGQYVAKIGRRTLFDEQHQQKVLRSFFTGSRDENTDGDMVALEQGST